MGEVLLYTVARGRAQIVLQGYLAHNKLQTPRTLQ